MKDSEKDLDRLILAAVLLVASAGALITGGLIADKQNAVPAVEIIEAEPEVTVFSSAAETAETTAKTAATDNAGTESLMVNINTADAGELMKLKGVGEKTAEKIIEYREQTPFETIEDIMNVNGIGEKKFEDMRDNICV